MQLELCDSEGQVSFVCVKEFAATGGLGGVSVLALQSEFISE